MVPLCWLSSTRAPRHSQPVEAAFRNGSEASPGAIVAVPQIMGRQWARRRQPRSVAVGPREGWNAATRLRQSYGAQFADAPRRAVSPS